MHRSHRNRITFAGLIAALAFAGVAGCKDEGPAEKAGRTIDEAAENVQEGVQDLTMDEGPLEAGRREGRRPDREDEGSDKDAARSRCVGGPRARLAGRTPRA
jgi:hypothetical protein